MMIKNGVTLWSRICLFVFWPLNLKSSHIIPIVLGIFTYSMAKLIDPLAVRGQLGDSHWSARPLLQGNTRSGFRRALKRAPDDGRFRFPCSLRDRFSNVVEIVYILQSSGFLEWVVLVLTSIVNHSCA